MRYRQGYSLVACLAAVAILALDGGRAAADGISLSWDGCAGGVADETFACNVNTGEHQLFCSFTLDQPTTDVLGVEIVIDIQHSDVSLPPWWQFAAGGCRYQSLSASGDPGLGLGPCTDIWLGAATGGLQGYQVGQPRGLPNQARIKIALALLPQDARSLSAGVTYFASVVHLSHALSTGTGSCAGCLDPACMVLNSIRVLRLPGSVGGDILIETPGLGSGNMATWQGGSATSCLAVPVKRSSWGAIKSLYR